MSEAADNFAIKHSSTEELLGGRRLLMAWQAINKDTRTTFWQKMLISPSGDKRFDPMYPSFTSRIRKIEEALKSHAIYQTVESEKINALITFLDPTSQQDEGAVSTASSNPTATQNSQAATVVGS